MICAPIITQGDGGCKEKMNFISSLSIACCHDSGFHPKMRYSFIVLRSFLRKQALSLDRFNVLAVLEDFPSINEVEFRRQAFQHRGLLLFARGGAPSLQLVKLSCGFKFVHFNPSPCCGLAIDKQT